MNSIPSPLVAVPALRLTSTCRALSRSPRLPGRAILLCLVCAGAAFAETSPALDLSISPFRTNNWPQLRMAGATNVVWSIEASENLSAWSDIARLHAPYYVLFWADPTILFFQDAAAPEHVRRFYRASIAPAEPDYDWKNQIYFPADPFATEGLHDREAVRWVKFSILTNEPARVYYQDARKYPFHYDFATERLAPLKGLTRDEFERAALRSDGQRVLLGAVLLPPASAIDRTHPGQSTIPEFGIQFVGQDPYPPERIVRWFELVRSTVAAAPNVRAVYMPVFEQTAMARANEDVLLERGIEIDTPARWLRGDICYAPGWALGRLNHIPPDQIDIAYADGRLTASDILVTDAVPAEIPFVAGIITLSPSTPNSHVAILARSYGVPFGYPADVGERNRILDLVNREILLQVVSDSSRCRVEVMAIDPDLDEGLRAELLALKTETPFHFPPKAHNGAIVAPADILNPSDIQYFGGKAAHFGLIRQAIPDHSPPAIAFSLDLWDEFMDQIFPTGNTLREEIATRLAHHPYPPNVAALKADLAAVRQMITSTASFSPAQREAILTALAGFDPDRKIRFRSSSNVEDGETFTGAGLYDSYSGCLLDELDGGSTGPSRCDPNQPERRGVFRAMQKVYASFYNDNAVIERLRRGADESKAGMGLLVHHSYPDDIELANGVATYLKSGGWYEVRMVTQAGAVSVTNPDSSAQPEVVEGPSLVLRQGSSLVQLGATVLTWPSEYSELIDLFDSVARGYEELYPDKTNFLLDFEYKKVQPGRLEVKQVRPLPLPAEDEPITPFLLNDPVEYIVLQAGSAFANHWGKLRLTLGTRNMRLDQTNVTAGLYAGGRFEYLDATEIKTLEGELSSWPDAFYGASPRGTTSHMLTNRWSVGDGPDRRDYELESLLSYPTATTQAPATSLRHLTPEMGPTLTVRFASPQFRIDWRDDQQPLTVAWLSLVPGPMHAQRSRRVERAMSVGPVRVETAYHYWRHDDFIMKVTPLLAWEQTRITGLTSEPITLRGHYSQSFGAGHHDWWKEFVFEPRLEPGLPEEQLAELESGNIRLLFVLWDAVGDSATMFILGFDGQVRRIE